MWTEWPLVIAAIAMVFAVAGYFLNRGSQYLTLREHNEFKAQVLTQLEILHRNQEKKITLEHFDALMADIHRSVDKAERALENRIDDIKFMIAEYISPAASAKERKRNLE